MRPGGKSKGESPFFETPNLSFEGRVRNVADPIASIGIAHRGMGAARLSAPALCPAIGFLARTPNLARSACGYHPSWESRGIHSAQRVAPSRAP